MQFSNDGANWSGWQAYATTASWTLSSGDGTKWVYTRFRDAAGNTSSPASDDILLDTAAPTVIATDPPAGVGDVTPEALVTAFLSEPMDPGTINGTTLRLVGGTVGAVAGTVSYDSGSWGAVFDPTASLAPDTYTATVSGGGGGARDAHGLPLAADYEWAFSVTPLHSLQVSASADPLSVPSAGLTQLSASAVDSHGHGIAAWSWSDGGSGGAFSPSSAAQNPSYTAPTNTTGSDLLVALIVLGTCDGGEPASDSDAVVVAVQSAALAVADFSGTPTGGALPLTIDFTDLSTSAPTSWTWEFGDGGTSVVQHPSHTYAVAGVYTVSLTVSNGYSSDTEIKTDYIRAGGPPTAAFSGAPTSGSAPLEVSFADESAGDPTSWSWEFGDGETSAAQGASHTYDAPGSYTVSLTVSNACGVDTEAKPDYVTVQAECGTLGALAADGGIGQVVRVPVVMTLDSLAVDRFGFSVRVDPVGAAPTLTGPLGFEVEPGLVPPGLVSPSGNGIAVSWLTPVDPPLTGGAVLGCLLVPIPAAAAWGDSYEVRMISVGASLGPTEECLEAGQGVLVTVCAEVLIGDGYPLLEDLNADGDTCDFGEFGDDALSWGDVITVFDAWAVPGSFPCGPGTDRVCAMDSYPRDTGDGRLSWGDVITTFDRWADPTLPRPWRTLPAPGPAMAADTMRTLAAGTLEGTTGASCLLLGTASGRAGSTVRVPVTLALVGQQTDRLAFSVESSGASVTGFEVASGLAAPTVMPESDGSISVAWLSPLSAPLSGETALGDLLVFVPATAAGGSVSRINFGAVGASLGQDELSPGLSAGSPGVVTVLAPVRHDVSLKRLSAPNRAKVGGTAKLTIEVQNLTPTAELATVRLLRNGAVIQSWLLSLGAKESAKLTATYQFQMADRPSVELRTEVVLAGDQHPENNAAAATVRVQ